MWRFGFVTLLFYSFSFPLLVRTSTTLNTINPNQPLRDGNTLISPNQTYELGFFSPSDPKIRYLGLWYKKISSQTIVWVANRETPISNAVGVSALHVTRQGNLVLMNGTNHIVWSSNTSRIARDPVAQLLDSGNFVVREANDSNPENFLWQSGDYPVDTCLPGMKFGRNLVTGHESFLSSWKGVDNPGAAEFSLHLDLNGYPQLLLKKGNKIQFRGGSWNGLRFTGTPDLGFLSLFRDEFIFNENEIYYKFEVQTSILARDTLNPSGLLQRLFWNDRINVWEVVATSQGDQCGNYAFCGAYATCHAYNNPVCSCLDGFTPKSPTDWNKLVWSDGCVRNTPLDCSNKDGFLKITDLKIPDTSSSWYNKSFSLKECQRLCLRNCSCTAYANLDIRGGGSGCLLWFNDLIDIRLLPAGGQDLYVRMAASELAKIDRKRSTFRKKEAGIIAAAVIAVISMLTFFYIWRRNLKKHGMKQESSIREYTDREGKGDMELPIFDLTTIVKATDNFSSNNKLGQGGFGPVYKGTLTDGQEIAVKRLSKNSGQGMIEFKNEVILISKLQHRNLVKLLGCCIQKDEKMLIYEFMPNKSLDFFIFDQMRSKLLDWPKRMHIIGGIARGLLYLHQDSRLRIIHRDLKPNNVLLDKDMNPKISDFGMARIFGVDQTEANTNRVTGTYGYMSPEYVVDGILSMKSDVFSFGVIVLEIVSGKKNRGFSHPDHDHNLLGHAWKLWIEERSLELIDAMLNSFAISEVLRCINVGLLCVQRRPEDRPNISSVVMMLGSESSLPQPKQPGFFTERNMPEADSSSSNCGPSSLNVMSTTFLEAR